MLSQVDIDIIKQQIKSGNPVYLYYVAHMIEGRETDILDEYTHKDVSRFKVVKVEVEDVQNAYFEYLNYCNNKDKYHVEEEEFYYHPSAKYMQCFITPNGNKTYNKDINPRMPSIIYGYIRKVYDEYGAIKEVHDPSPVKALYTNVLEFNDLVIDEKTGKNAIKRRIESKYSNEFNWKYMKLDNSEIVDGIEYKYVTSDWYILTLKNYPMIEKPLINVLDHSAYFLDIQEAFNYIEQLIS